MGVVYKIKNTINEKIYIGQTIRNFRHRKNEYRNGAGNTYLVNAFIKYGFNNFIFEVLHESNDINILNDIEIDLIKKFDSCNRKIGYNIAEGGRNAIPSSETRVKMSASHKGIEQGEEWKDKRIAKAGSEEAKKYGKAKTEEEKKALSEKTKGENSYWFGKKRDPEMVKRMAESKRGKTMNPTAKAELMTRQAKKVEMIDSLGAITLFESQTDASISTGISVNSISSYCKGKFKNKQGLIFRYI